MKKFLAVALALTMALSISVSAADNTGFGFFSFFKSLFNYGSTSTPSYTTTTKAPETDPPKTDPVVKPSVTKEDADPYDTPITPAAKYKPVFTVPAYSGKAYVAVNGNEPFFKESEKTTVAFEYYGALDSLKRCTYTFACVGQEMMPTGSRGSLSHKPTGWVQNTYDFVEGKSLYNRCHLIAWRLTGENNNKQNLITGTRYLNIQGMVPFEDMVADYIKETGNHVMYRVTPIYTGNNLLADGVLIEGWSVEDEGDGICFNVYSYNVQPGVVINYKTGENYAASSSSTSTTAKPTQSTQTTQSAQAVQKSTFVVNKSGYKVHTTTCASAKRISTRNRIEFVGTVEELLAKYPKATSAGCCHPY